MSPGAVHEDQRLVGRRRCSAIYLPDLFLNNTIARRQQSIMRAFPDALDLMLICVESGMSIESVVPARRRGNRFAVGRAGRGAGADHRRTLLPARPPPGVRESCQALRPFWRQGRRHRAEPGRTIRYADGPGTARRLARKTANSAWPDAEQKAASLPAKLTVPMILFFLPCLFVVILGPAIMKIMHMVHH